MIALVDSVIPDVISHDSGDVVIALGAEAVIIEDADTSADFASKGFAFWARYSDWQTADQTFSHVEISGLCAGVSYDSIGS